MIQHVNQQKSKEILIILSPYTVVQVFAMVVELLCASPASIAMVGSYPSPPALRAVVKFLLRVDLDLIGVQEDGVHRIMESNPEEIEYYQQQQQVEEDQEDD